MKEELATQITIFLNLLLVLYQANGQTLQMILDHSYFLIILPSVDFNKETIQN